MYLKDVWPLAPTDFQVINKGTGVYLKDVWPLDLETSNTNYKPLPIPALLPATSAEHSRPGKPEHSRPVGELS